MAGGAITAIFCFLMLFSGTQRDNNDRDSGRDYSAGPDYYPESSAQDLSVLDLFRGLFEPIKLSITKPGWRDSDDKIYRIVQPPIWKEDLRHELCILDFDNRDVFSPNNVLNNGLFHYEKLEGSHPGVLNHYLYGE
jgi:hypothetical protein